MLNLLKNNCDYNLAMHEMALKGIRKVHSESEGDGVGDICKDKDMGIRHCQIVAGLCNWGVFSFRSISALA